MRDPRQLELNFNNSESPLSIVEQDALVLLRLQRSSVANYCYGVTHGHKVKCDRNPPSHDAVIDYLDYLKDNKNKYNSHYVVILEELLEASKD